MKAFNTKTVLVDLDGTELKSGDKALTAGIVITNTLTGPVSNPARGYQLAKQVHANEIVQLKAEDVNYICQELEKNRQLPAVISGQVIDILNEKDEE